MTIAAEEKGGDLVQDRLQGALTAEDEENIEIEATKKIENHHIDLREGTEHREDHEMRHQIQGQEVHPDCVSSLRQSMTSSKLTLRGKE